MKLVKQTLLSASCWCFLLGLAFMWNPQAIQAKSSFDHMESMESNGQVTGFLLNKQDGSALMHLSNGATFCESDFPNDIRIRTTESGNHQSLRFTITGPGGTWTNTENHVPYDSKQFWPTPGTYTVRADLYSHDNLGGTRYDRETISFTVTDCNALPSLNCNNGDFVWEGSTRLIHSSNTLESYNLPAIFNNATSVDISEVLATDSYANRGNVTQNDERLKLVFRRNGQMTGMSNYTPDLQDRVVTAVYQGSLGTVQLSNGADELLVVHPGNTQFGQSITNSANSLDINGICLNAVQAPCSITVTSSNIVCDGNGTTSIDDDTYTVDITVTGSNTGNRWNGTLGGQTKEGAYGSTVTFGPFNTNHGSTISGWFMDNDDSNCDFDITVTPPNGCSPTDPCANAGGDNDGDGVCNNDDCRPNNPNISSPGDACNDGNANTMNDVIQGDCSCAGTPVGPTFDCPALGANIGDACNDGNANTSNDVVQANCTCAGTPNPPSGCDATYSVNGRVITVSNLTGATKAVKIIDNQWNTLYSCDDWGTNVCGGSESFTVPSCGTYSVQIQTYADWSTQICNVFETFEVDSDCGVTVDCPALNANIGDACNDGNPNTTNDQVQANCTCAGTPTGPVYDCAALGANIGDACDDGNANTNNDVVTSSCGCAGTPAGPTTCDATYRVEGNKIIIEGLNAGINTAKILTSSYGTEAECSDWTTPCGGMLMATVPNGTYFVQIQTYADWSTPLCNIFEEVTVGGGGPVYDCPALGANIGDACDDGNANTNNDVVTANCGCAGTPVGPTTCDATYRVEGDKIIIEGLDAAINTAKILDNAWATVAECSDWTTACNGMLMATVPNGDYFVQIQTYADWSTPLCDIFEEVTISGGTGGCDNVTDSGTIGGDETGCGAYNPGPITSVALPTGGSGAIEYLWLSSTTECPRYLTQAIDGANQSTYDPGMITQTTYYVRCSRRAGCTDWTRGESNCVVKTVDNNCNTGICADRTVSNSTACSSGNTYGVFTQGGNYFTVSNGSFVEFDNGTAEFTGHANGLGDINVTFTGRTTNGTAKFSNCVGQVSTADWYYYSGFSGTIGNLTIFSRGEEFHVGTGGNNQQAGVLGASGWWEATDGTLGDINILLSGAANACSNGGGNTGTCADRTATNTISNCGQGETYGFYAANIVDGASEGNRYSISNANFVEYTDGTARYTARATSNDDSWVRWDIDITFSGRTSTAPADSPKVGSCHGAGNDYYYYASTNGTLTGRDVVAGALINVTRNGEAFQVGTGANLQDTQFGASGWLAYTIVNQPNDNGITLRNGVGMDINIRLSGNASSCVDPGPSFDCPTLGANIGDACNDGDANTENDTVQSDCSCAGTPTGGGACDISISVSGNSITVTGAVGPFPNVGIFDDFGNTIYECHAFNGGCPTVVTVDDLAPGVYWVSGRVVDSDWVTVLCEAFEDPMVGGAGRESNGQTMIEVEKQSITLPEAAPDFKVFPNPANEIVNISLDGYYGKDVTIQLIDFSGKAVKSVDIDNVETTSYTIPIERMNNGIYTVRILSQGIKPIGKKMIVNKQF